MFLSIFTLKRVNCRGGGGLTVTKLDCGRFKFFRISFWLCQDLNLAGVKSFNKNGGKEGVVDDNRYNK